MRSNAIGTNILILALGFLSMLQFRVSAESGPLNPASASDAKVNVFFGSLQALEIGEVRTNALAVLKARGHSVPAGASCVINVTVMGQKPGCAVMFWDFEKRYKYQVEFNGQGKVSEVWAGKMRHGTVGPSDSSPKVPADAVKAKP